METKKYTTEAERDSILAEQKSAGMVLTEEQNITSGNFLIFESAPVKTQEEQIKEYVDPIQAHLDSAAQELGYDNIFTACSYADEDSVAKFQTEGQAFRKWRSLVWQKAYEILDEVTSGARTAPSLEELLSELPALGL